MPNVGFETWLPKRPDTVFIVQNITQGTPQQKTIHIFQAPIPPGKFRDLLALPVVSEADIRHSLLKGELRIKAECGEICILRSNIDLIQFDPMQKAFLESIACSVDAIDGLECECPTDGYVEAVIPYLFKQNVELLGDKNNSNRIFTVPSPDKFINGTFEGNTFRILIRHNGRVLVEGVDYSVSESGGVGTGFDTILLTFTPKPRSQLYANYVIEATP